MNEWSRIRAGRRRQQPRNCVDVRGRASYCGDLESKSFLDVTPCCRGHKVPTFQRNLAGSPGGRCRCFWYPWNPANPSSCGRRTRCLSVTAEDLQPRCVCGLVTNAVSTSGRDKKLSLLVLSNLKNLHCRAVHFQWNGDFSYQWHVWLWKSCVEITTDNSLQLNIQSGLY